MKHRIAPPAFTLLEVVLAIGLTCTLLALLTTAIDIYLVRVDANRSKVEASQLARTLLDQIAADIRSVRFYWPESLSGQDSSSDSSSSSSSTTSTLDTEETGKVQGIFGTPTELRIDRAARWNWLRTAREVDPTEPAAQNEMPTTVAYVFNDGITMLTDQLAALGVLTDASLPGYAGLYRQQTPTPAWIYQASATGVSLSSVAQVEPELLAPEVLTLEFSYFDGNELFDSWDTAQQESLPVGIEIRLTILAEPYELARTATTQERELMRQNAENAIQYKLFVLIPDVAAPQEASASSEGGSQQNQGGGGPGGSGGGGSSQGGGGRGP